MASPPAAERAVRLRAFGATLCFETDGAGSRAAGAPLAGEVWDAALVCFHYLAREPPGFTRRELAGTTAVELGAGTGVAGVALALLGCHVLLTDQEAALPLLRRNLAAAAAAAPSHAPLRAAAAPLAWGGDAQAAAAAACAAAPSLRLAPPVALVLGSDVVYDAALVPPLLATLRALAGAHTRALFAVDAVRAPAALAAFRAGALANGWRLERVPDAQLDPVVRHPDIQLLLLHRSGAADAAAWQDDDSVHSPAGGAAGGVDAQAWHARRQGTAAARLLAGIAVPLREDAPPL